MLCACCLCVYECICIRQINDDDDDDDDYTVENNENLQWDVFLVFQYG